MKKVFVSMLVLIVVLSMLNEDLRADVIYDVRVQTACDFVTISWRVSGYASHTNVHWESGESGYSSAKTGSGSFSQTFYLSSGDYSIRIHATVSGTDYFSGVERFRISGCYSTPTPPPKNDTVTPTPPPTQIISNIDVKHECNRVIISWYVSQYTEHTNVHWKSGKSCCSRIISGQGYFSQTFYLSTGSYSFEIHARISGRDYYSYKKSFWFVKWC